MHRGYIKLWRKTMESLIFHNSEVLHLWIFMLLKANHKDKETLFNGSKIMVGKGQMIIGRKSVELSTGVSEWKIRRYLSLMENEHLIAQQKTNKYTLVSIVNWDSYQDDAQQDAQQTANKPPTNRQQLTTSKTLINTNKNKDLLPDRPLTDVQKVVLTYKIASGYPKEDKSWDQAHFARCTKSAKSLLDFMDGNWKWAADCIQDVYEKLTAKGLTVTLETVFKHSADWKKDKQEREAQRGVFHIKSDAGLSVVG